jgi:hypothetical protein
MARDVGYGCSRVVDGFTEEVQKELGFLAFSVEQRAMGNLGLARPRLRADFSAAMPCDSQHPGSDQEPIKLNVPPAEFLYFQFQPQCSPCR